MNRSQVIEKLKSPHVADVIGALTEIEQQRNMRDLPLTIGMIRNRNQLIKRAAVQATCTIIRDSIISNYHSLGRESRLKLATIVNTIHPDIIRELIRDIQGDNEEQRVYGIMILGLMSRRPDVNRILIMQLKSTNKKVRATAVQALGNHPDSAELTMLNRQLEDSDKRVQANTIEAIEQFGDPNQLFSIKRFINDDNNRVRANALKAVYHLGDQEVEEQLLDMIRGDDPMMIASGLWLVAELKLKSPEIREACEALDGSRDPMIMRNVKRAVKIFIHK